VVDQRLDGRQFTAVESRHRRRRRRVSRSVVLRRLGRGWSLSGHGRAAVARRPRALGVEQPAPGAVLAVDGGRRVGATSPPGTGHSISDYATVQLYIQIHSMEHKHTHTRLTALFPGYPGRPVPERYKKLSYRRGTARCVVSVKILPTATQRCRNYL